MVQIQKKRISRKQLKRTKRSRANRIIKRGGQESTAQKLEEDRFYNINVISEDRQWGMVPRVHPNDTVLTLKKYILAGLEINMEDQRLTFNGRVLDDGEILSECGIQQNSNVWIKDLSDLWFPINLTTLDSEAATFRPQVHPTKTVLFLKNYVLGIVGIPVDDQRITFNGRELDDDEILSECGIEENSTVYVEDISQ